jgi:hypothetical protein
MRTSLFSSCNNFSKFFKIDEVATAIPSLPITVLRTSLFADRNNFVKFSKKVGVAITAPSLLRLPIISLAALLTESIACCVTTVSGFLIILLAASRALSFVC